SVTITAWESVRATAADLAALGGGGGGAAARDAVTGLAIAAGSVAVNVGAGDFFTLSLTSNVTGWTFSGLPGAGKGCSILVLLTQDATGGRTVALPAAFKLSSGSELAVASAAGAKTAMALTSMDSGTTWICTLSSVAA
ncbi:hypothetical protein CLD22_27815, partial [Rubrivivax gelatinosus]|nr:hypothetical protein [Rubrivivax gelatinosus]